MKEKALRFIHREPMVWAPICLFCTLSLILPTHIPYELLFLASVGFALSAILRVRGLWMALALLTIAAVIRHVFLIEEHLWQLGLEGSLGLSYVVTALVFEEKNVYLQTLQSQLTTRDSTLQNLEEELRKTQELAQVLQMNFQDKVASLQKELEELQLEHSSILILNEVLRKTTARHTQEAKEAQDKALLAISEMEQMRIVRDESQKALAHFKESDELIVKARTLSQEKEQLQAIYETLERLYLREKFKVQETEEEAVSLKMQLQEMRRFPQPKPAPEETKVHLSQIEPLFKQLKEQFEEKNQILHQTRADLFKSDTEVQKLRIEKSALDLQPFPKEVEVELEILSDQVEALEKENKEMQEIITVLSSSTERKKKVKMQQSPSDQTLLF